MRPILQEISAFLSETSFLNNSLERYIWAIVAFFLLKRGCKIFQTILLKKITHLLKGNKSEKRHIRTVLLDYFRHIPQYFFVTLSLLLPISFLDFGKTINMITSSLIVILVSIQLIMLIQKITRYFLLEVYLPNEDGDPTTTDQTKANILEMIIKIIVRITGVLFILINLGIEITPLIASLGVGGIAVGFALQNILSDVFSSFSIFFDKPFSIGDFVVIGGEMGTVQDITLKSTRLQTLSGEMLVIPNKEVTNTKVNNFATIKKRRKVLQLGVTYETKPELLKKIPDIIKDIITKTDLTKFDRAHFAGYGASSLDFEIVYYVLVGDYGKFMDINQSINFAIFDAFAKAGIEFAYPTQTIYTKGH